MTEMAATQPIKIYLSCSQEDHELGRKLKEHLGVLERDGEVTVWQNWDISPGVERADEMAKHLNSASIILLLISSSFFASAEQSDYEEPQAIKKHKAKEACVIPVILRPCDWKSAELSNLQALPRNSQAITSWQNQDEAFKEVADEIRNAIKNKSDYISLPQTSKRRFKIPWRSLRTTLFTSIGITTLVVFTRFLGVLQPLELFFFDQMMTLKGTEPQDDLLLLITITSDDIKQYGSSKGTSLADKTMLDLIKKLQVLKPQAIGFDLYRDWATEKSQESLELSNILKTDKNIFVVCKVPDKNYNSQAIAPPSDVPEDRIGFSDFLSENVFRRQLLHMNTKAIKSPCSTKDGKMDSFSFKLAQHYLMNNKKQYKWNEKISEYTSDNVVLQRLYGSNTGGYQLGTDFDGYQVLLNYRVEQTAHSIQNIAPIKTVQEAINYKPSDNPSDNPFKGKIILIGTDIQGIDDFFTTPFQGPKISGLIMQAQMVSQLVRAAKGERYLIQVWSVWYEIIWILNWSLIAATIVQMFRSTRSIIISGGVAFISLYVSCLLLFRFLFLWVPFVPPVFTFIGTGGFIIFIKFKAQKFSS